MRAEDVVEIYSSLLEHGVQLWIDGGWGIDALLERQTRLHKDLDAILAFDDLPAMTAALSERGFVLKEIWGENRWARHEGRVLLVGTGESGGDVATAFVLNDARGRELDVHVMRFDELGRGTPAWSSIWSFPLDALEGHGVIAGSPVRCLSAATHMRTHIGYELQDKDVQDLRFLHERFGIDYPEEHAHLMSENTSSTSFQTSITATLSVRNWDRAMEFYKAAFGANELYRVPGGGVAQLSVSGAPFWVAEESPAHLNFSPESLGGCSVRMLLLVEDPAAVCAQAVVAGASEVAPVAEEHGWRLGRIVDPFGHHWEIARQLE